jgi:transposase
MGRRKTGLNKIRDIIRTSRTTSLSQRQIASALGISRTVVDGTLRAFRASGVQYTAAEQMPDSQLRECLEQEDIQSRVPRQGLAVGFPEMPSNSPFEQEKIMLGISQAYVIRYKHFVEHISIRRIAREMGLSRNTVRKDLSGDAESKGEDHAHCRIGRQKITEPFRTSVQKLLQQEPQISTAEVLRRIQLDGYEGCKSVLYTMMTSMRPRTVPSKWRITHVCEEDLAELKRWRRSSNRTNWAKAVVVLDSQGEASLKSLCSKVEKPVRLLRKWLGAFQQKGMDGLRSRHEKKHLNPDKIKEMETKRDRIIEVLHESPNLHGINRASWTLGSLARAYERKYDESIGRTTISEYVRAEHYTFRKARRVLTSPDPNYREKLKEITKILSNLREDEKFFSVDEFGPFAVKMQGGRALTKQGTTRLIPQRQRSKGRLIVTAALELSTNQMTHFYSETKNTEEMIKLLDILLQQYANQRRLYLSWDAASWHISRRLTVRVSEINTAVEARKSRQPMVRLAPLPASAQFLNVIESVFSGMARAVIHNSDYQSVDECKAAIDLHIADRNEVYKKNPRRAGNKIWGKEIVEPRFKASNNCKDPSWR